MSKQETKPKRRRFLVGTLTASTDEVNEVARKFLVRVRYHADYSRTTDYFIEGPRRFVRE